MEIGNIIKRNIRHTIFIPLMNVIFEKIAVDLYNNIDDDLVSRVRELTPQNITIE